jgi:hypothetical protein
MRVCATIAGAEVSAESDFVVYGPATGKIAECSDLAECKSVLREKTAELNECNVQPDLAIYRWADGKWVGAISLYEMQEWELEKNPSRLIHYP